MSIELTLIMLQNAAKSASHKHGRSDLSDDLTQDLWLDSETIIRNFNPEKGTIESFLYRHAEYMLLGMIRGVKEVHVENIHEVNREITFEGGEAESEAPENDIIQNIDKNSALDKIRAKLKRNGCNPNLKVVQTYKEKLEGRKVRKKLKGKHDSLDRQRLAELEKRSGASRARFANGLGLSPQTYQSYIDGTVMVIPAQVMERAETVVIEKMPVPYTEQEMVAWCGRLMDLISMEGETLRRKEEYISNIVNSSRTTVTRWRLGKTKLMPEKAKGITKKVQSYVESLG